MKHRPQSHMQQPTLGQGGFTLVEMAIVLLIAGLLVAGISQMMSASQKNRGDQAVANEVRTVTNALERMLVDQQAALAQQINNVDGLTKGINAVNFPPGPNNLTGSQFLSNYLPKGLNINNYNIGILRNDINGRPSFRALIIRPPDNPLDDARLARIASLIGTQGGMISNSAGTTGAVTGVLGSWNVTSTDYSIPVPPCNSICASPGYIAALTNTVDAQISVNTLSRIGAAGTGVWSEANTMRNDLFMGSAGNANNGGVSDAWAIHNASGIGYVLTNAYSTEACGPTIAVNYYSTSSGPPGGAALGTFNPDNYMIVTGYTDNTYATPALLQCSGTTNQWQQVGGGNNNLQVRSGTVTVTTPCGNNMADANTFVTYKDPTTGLPSPFPNNTLGISTAYYVAENQGGAILYSAEIGYNIGAGKPDFDKNGFHYCIVEAVNGYTNKGGTFSYVAVGN